MTWAVLFDDQPLRKQDQMEKSAGVFMRPSDIADHTNLAGALEGMLSQQPSREFRHEPGEMKFAGAAEMAIGGLIGGAIGGKVTHAVANSRATEAPEEVRGVRGQVNKAKRKAADWARENPKKAIALGTAAGVGLGVATSRNRQSLRRLNDILRVP